MRTKSAASEIHPNDGLQRSLGLFSLVALGVGATIGTGIFFVMTEAVPKAGPAVLWSFALAGLAAALTALCYAELSSTIPASGSAYSYTYVAIGEFVAFIVGACLLLEYTLAAGATSIGWSQYLNNFLENALGVSIPRNLASPSLIRGPDGLAIQFGNINLPPMLLAVLCCALLLRGARKSAAVNAIMVVIKVSILGFFAAVAFTAFNAAHFTPFNPYGFLATDPDGEKVGIVAAAGTIFFSFIGLDAVATAGAEVRNPRRDVPLAIIIALLVVVTAYMLVAVAAVGAQPAAAFQGQEAGLAVILGSILSANWPPMLLSAGAVISVFSVTLVTIFGQTRILYAISRDGLIPGLFCRLNERTRAPTTTTLIVCAVVALIGGLVDPGYLWDMVSMGTLVAFSVVAIGVIVMRHRAPDVDSRLKLPGGTWLIPLASVAVCFYIIIGLSPVTHIVFTGWMTVALVTYFAYGVRKSALNVSLSVR